MSEKVVDDVSGFNGLITQITKRNDKRKFSVPPKFLFAVKIIGLRH